MNKGLFVLIIFAVFFGVLFWYFGGSGITDELPYYLKKVTNDIATIKLGSTKITAEIVTTPAAQARGLSGRERLPEGRGMLFKFSKPGIYTITMREMLFPIDIIWIKDGRVVHMQNNAPAPAVGEDPVLYTPSQESTYILEVRQEVIEASGIRVGDEVSIENKRY